MAVKRALVWPPPVYVARFSDGVECRMSVGDYRGGKKATGYDFGKGRRVCCSAIGAERVYDARRSREAEINTKRETIGRRPLPWYWHPDNYGLCFPPPPPAADIVAGHFEHDGEIIPDPFFSNAETVEPVRKRVSALDKLIASLDKLTVDDLAMLSVEVDMRLAAE